MSTPSDTGPVGPREPTAGIGSVNLANAHGVQMGDRNLQLNVYQSPTGAPSSSAKGRRRLGPWRVFLSHTGELSQYPTDGSFVAAARRAVERAGHVPVEMDTWTAGALPPVANDIEQLTSCQVYVGILGFRYGTPVREDPSLSYTQHEFDTAAQLGLPTLIFLLAEDLEVPVPRAVTHEPNHEFSDRQEQLRKCVTESGVTCGLVRSPGNLETGLYQALVELADMIERNPSVREHSGSDMRYRRALDSYRRRVRDAYETLPWISNSVAIQARLTSGVKAEAKLAIGDWLESNRSRCLVIIGDFGSGKTGLLRWLSAHVATSMPDIIPITVPLSEVRAHNPRNMSELASIADPYLPEMVPEIVCQHMPLILLDGLDEVVDPRDRSLSPHRPVLEALGRILPKQARIVITCRSMFYEAVSFDVNRLEEVVATDRTEAAITTAITGAYGIPELMTLCDIDLTQAETYLQRGIAGAAWSKTERSHNIFTFMTSPFTLRMLERALPVILSQHEQIDLDMLYEIGIKSMLLRDGRLTDAAVEAALGTYEELAGGAPQASKSEPMRAGMACGLLREIGSGGVTFHHRSFLEFFLSRRLFGQMSDFDASLLARLDLIGGFNVCRFLVPRLRSNLDISAIGDTVKGLAWLTETAYAEFCKATGWRHGVGYGIHPYFERSDSPLYSTEPDLLLDGEGFSSEGRDEGLATRVSWFDAIMYCRWSGRRLLHSDQLAGIDQGITQGRMVYSWADDWNNEKRAYIAAHCFNDDGSRIVGLNPDFRSKDLGILTGCPE
jgi:hypothetical protein